MTKRYREFDYDDHEYFYDSSKRRLRRNKIDGVIGGVCAGLGDYFGLDPIIARIIFVLLVVFTGIPLLIYFILWIFIPSDKRAPYVREYREARKARHEARLVNAERPARTASFRDVKSKFRSLEERLQDLERSITSKEWRLHREFRDLEK